MPNIKFLKYKVIVNDELELMKKKYEELEFKKDLLIGVLEDIIQNKILEIDALNSLLSAKQKVIDKLLIDANNQPDYNFIMNILVANNENTIMHILNQNGKEKIEFPVNNIGGRFDVTLGFNSYGEDVCSKEFSTYLDALKFSAIRTLLGYQIKAY